MPLKVTHEISVLMPVLRWLKCKLLKWKPHWALLINGSHKHINNVCGEVNRV